MRMSRDRLERYRYEYERLLETLSEPNVTRLLGDEPKMIPWIGSVAYVRGHIERPMIIWTDPTFTVDSIELNSPPQLEPFEDLAKVVAMIRERISTIDSAISLRAQSALEANPTELLMADHRSNNQEKDNGEGGIDIREEWSVEDEERYNSRFERKAHVPLSGTKAKSKVSFSIDSKPAVEEALSKEEGPRGELSVPKLTKATNAVRDRIVERKVGRFNYVGMSQKKPTNTTNTAATSHVNTATGNTSTANATDANSTASTIFDSDHQGPSLFRKQFHKQ